MAENAWTKIVIERDKVEITVPSGDTWVLHDFADGYLGDRVNCFLNDLADLNEQDDGGE